MPSQAAVRRQVADDLIPEADNSLVGLVQELIKQAPCGTGQALVLDIQVDGVRCVLTRVTPGTERDIASLSPRELEISRMIAKGYPNKVIASVLDISTWTVCTHLRRIFSKLNVTSRAAMVARLSESGVLAEGRR